MNILTCQKMKDNRFYLISNMANNNKPQKPKPILTEQIQWVSNTHMIPSFVTDDKITLKLIPANAILKVYLIVLRYSAGFQRTETNEKLSNSKIANHTGIDTRNVKRALKELKNKYKLIDYESTQGGREIRSIRILLPSYYHKTVSNVELETALNVLTKNGYKVLAPEEQSKAETKKGDKNTNKDFETGDKIKEKLKEEIPAIYYEAFILPCKFYLNGVFLFVECPNEVILNHLTKKYSNEIQETAKELTQQKIVLKITLKED